MNKVAIAFLTKDRVELSRRTIEPLLQSDKFDLFWFDGSSTAEGRQLAMDTSADGAASCHLAVGGGADAAIAYALTTMVEHTRNYDYVGLVENDVLLEPDWFDRTMALFTKHWILPVGAVSPRAYEDRVLFQRENYAVMHNLGWGTQIMTREAAHLALKFFRTGLTTENRRVFSQVSGIDIGTYWAFRASEHMIVADWNNDRTLAAHGFASLALTPSPVEMIGQVPPLAEQGLKLVTEPVASRSSPACGGFERYASNLARIREGKLAISTHPRHRGSDGTETIFAHQVFGLEEAAYEGAWRLKNCQGFGPFGWRSTQKGDSFEALISGTCDLMVSAEGGNVQVEVKDSASGYCVAPVLPSTGQVMHLVAPAGVSYRKVRLTALTPGLCFHGVRCRENQPERLDWAFDHSVLPPVE